MLIYKRTIRALKRIGRNIDDMSCEQLTAWDNVVTKIIVRKRLKEVIGYAQFINRICKIVITDDFDKVQYSIFEVRHGEYIYYIIRDSSLDVIYVKRIKFYGIR